jgi:hypothetical protein
MPSITVADPVADRTEAVRKVFEAAEHPLTLSQAKKAYQGPKLMQTEWPKLVEDQLLMSGQLFKCTPYKSKAPRYWAYDEEQKVRDAAETLLGQEALARSTLIKAIQKELPSVSSESTLEGFLESMLRDGALHEGPGRGKGKAVALSPTAFVRFAPKTLESLSRDLKKAEGLGVNVDQFLLLLREHLQPQVPSAEPPASPLDNGFSPQGELDHLGELEELILKGMRDLEPAVSTGASVLIRDLRRNMPHEYQQHETFDVAVIRLAEQGRVVLHRHDQPSFLTDQERDELVRDEAGTYFTAIAHRV